MSVGGADSPSGSGAPDGADPSTSTHVPNGDDTTAAVDAAQRWRRAHGDALRWCHERLRAGSGGAEDPAEPSTVRAMPIVLHISKPDAPPRTALLEAAAGAVARVCLDARVAPGGPWHERYSGWMDARMRKIARRARGGQWRTAEEVAGVTWEVDGAGARAFEPGPVDAVDRRIGRLQIGGTELPLDEPGPPPADVPVVWIDAGLEMSVGKAAAQVGHGVMLLAAAMTPDRLEVWIGEGLPLAVRSADAVTWERLVADLRRGVPGTAAVVDAGFTEVAPGSTTVVAEDPRARPGE